MYYKFYSEFNELWIIFVQEGSNSPLWIPENIDNSDYKQFLDYLALNNLTIDDIPLWVP
jgi:hypothetical protein